MVMREKLTAIMEDLGQELGLESTWKQDTIHFNRMGVTGTVTFDDKQLRIQARIPFYVPVSEAWLREQIEARIDHYLVNL